MFETTKATTTATAAPSSSSSSSVWIQLMFAEAVVVVVFLLVCLLLLVKLTIFKRSTEIMWTHQQQLCNRTRTARKFGREYDFYFACCQAFFVPSLLRLFCANLGSLVLCMCDTRACIFANEHRSQRERVNDTRESEDLSRITSNGLHITNRITIHSK